MRIGNPIPTMSDEEIENNYISIFQLRGALLTNGHFVYKSGKHGAVYVNKDAIYPYLEIHELCIDMIKGVRSSIIDICEIVAGPALGGIVLSRLAADYISQSRESMVLAVYAEKTADGQFEFRRGYDKLIADKRVLIVEDIMTSGESVALVKAAAERCGAKVIGVAVLWNRGGITADMLQVPYLTSLINHQFPSWEAADCPLCKQGVPVNPEVGHGREYLTRRAMEDVVKAANMAVAEVFGGDKKK